MGLPPVSLKAYALGLLARREHSRHELRAKLISHLRKRAAQQAQQAQTAQQAPAELSVACCFGATVDGTVWAAPEPSHFSGGPDEADPAALAAEVDQTLDWLAAQRYLSDERFVETRLHARAPRMGRARIAQELSRLGVQMSAEQSEQLRDTELARAREVWTRRYGELATTPQERARQARFLASRGFAAEVVWRVVGGRADD